MNRIGLKISCLAISVVIWFVIANTVMVEQNSSLPLQVRGLADDLTLAGDPLPQSVYVRLRGSKLNLLTHRYFNSYIGEVRINLANMEPGEAFRYTPGRSDVITDLEVASLDAVPTLMLQIHRKVSKKLPLRVVTEGILDQQLGLLVPIRLEPDSVTVTGPEGFFPEQGFVRTEPLKLDRLGKSETFTLSLVSPHKDLQLAEATCSAGVFLAEVEDRTLANIPVIPLVDSGQPEVGISPPVVDVMVRGVADSVRTLTEARFLVTIAVGGLQEGLYVLPGQVQFPPCVRLIGLDPPEFQVIVGNSAGGAPVSAKRVEGSGE